MLFCASSESSRLFIKFVMSFAFSTRRTACEISPERKLGFVKSLNIPFVAAAGKLPPAPAMSEPARSRPELIAESMAFPRFKP